MRLTLLLLVVILASPSVLGAELSGTIYDQNLDQATNVVVTVDTTPHQRILSTDGTYVFTIPPGNYTITAQYQLGSSNLTATENIAIRTDGTFVFDIFLFPGLDAELLDPVDPVLEEDELLEDAPVQQSTAQGAFVRFLIIALVFLFFYVAWRFLANKTEEEGLPAEMLAFIDKSGGRVTQKELRKQFPLSEAKISLVVTELESAGKIQKIRKGRANILVRKK